jgi:hypothetical protein
MSNDFTFFDNFELSGWWWLPDRPGGRLYGTLKYKNGESISLELTGSFSDENIIFGGKIWRSEIIIGFSENGKEVTLLTNYEISRSSHAPGTTRSIIISDYIFLGKHFISLESIRFSAIQANYTNLEEWMWDYPFESKHENDIWSTSYKRPQSFKARVPSLNSIIESAFSVRNSGDGFRTFEWVHAGFIRLTPSQENNFKWFLRQLIDIQYLLSLCANAPIYIKYITALGNKVYRPLPGGGLYYDETIDIYFIQARYNVIEKIHPLQMLINLSVIRNKLRTILELWFNNANILRSVYDLYFGYLYNPRMYIQFLFLSLVQALESFHRIKMSGKYINDKGYKKYEEMIINSIPPEINPDHRDSLKARIKYGNEFSLRKRFNEILFTLRNTINKIDIPANVISDKIVDTRNYLTHYDEEALNKSLQNEELFYANQLLSIIITILLLREAGFKEEMLITAFINNRYIKDLLPNIRKTFKGKKLLADVPIN